MSELKQTKGYAQLRGIIGGLDRVKDDIAKGSNSKNYKDNEKIKQLRFSIKTSEDNIIYLQLTQFKTGKAMDNVLISKYDKETGKRESKKVVFNERHRSFGEGWNVVGVSLKSVNDEFRKSMVAYDAIDYVLENFEDGQSVFANAEISHYNNGNTTYHNYELKQMYMTDKPIDFKADDFVEQSEFVDNFIFSGTYPESEGLVVQGFSVDYTLSLQEVDYLIKVENDDDKRLSEYFEKQMKPGDLVKVIGILNNRAKYTLTKIDDDSSSNSNILGRKTKAEEQKSKPRYEKEIEYEEKNLQIIGLDVDTIKGGYYDLNGIEDDDDLPF